MISDLKIFHIDNIKPSALFGLNWFWLVSVPVPFLRVCRFYRLCVRNVLLGYSSETTLT